MILLFQKWRIIGRRKLVVETDDIEERIQQIYLVAFSRKPTENEIKTGREFIENQSVSYDVSSEELKDDLRIWADYCHAIFNLKEFIHLI